MSPVASAQKCANPHCTKPDGSSALQKCSRCRKEAYCSKECQAARWGSHKSTCRRPNYVIRVEVAPGKIKNPSVTRVLSCPADVSFYMLHMALQTAFGWATTHSFDFAVPNPHYEPSRDFDMSAYVQRLMARGPNGISCDPSAPQQYLFRITDPVEMSPTHGIDRMHEGPRMHPNTPEKKANAYKLYQFFDDAKYQGKGLIYTYDFGDNWATTRASSSLALIPWLKRQRGRRSCTASTCSAGLRAGEGWVKACGCLERWTLPDILTCPDLGK
ncbi:hypothetical protein F4778DRAFT_305061 [Xylariomycetidae sp. FL2044]|nr:hypothetical protein F4778DRAFT_305061 [Xylariomycetidae sp. FL2044]